MSPAPVDPVPEPARSRTLEQALERVQRLHPKRIDLSLGRMRRLLGALDAPERRLPPVVHVAGTNGKGSTVAFLRAFLEAAGHRVHVYTSPHLVRFTERIRLAGAPVDDDTMIALLDRCEAANGGLPITYFEITTAAAFLAFAEVPADILLLEVGMGGRLDATNVIDRPLVTAITRISMDHQQFLGDTLAAIAAEKAGILKPGVPAVLGPQGEAAAVDTVRARAALVGAPLRLPGRDWRCHHDAAGFVLETGDARRRFPTPALEGDHQIANAATAIVTADHLPGFGLDQAALAQGLLCVDWPGRLQPIRRGPLFDQVPPGSALWLDGGHNDSAGEALAGWAASRRAEDGQGVDLIVGMLESKDPVAFLRPLAAWARRLRAIRIPGEPASLPPDGLVEAARRAGMADADVAADVARALTDLAPAGRPGTVLICGSLYLVGHILRDHA